MKKIIIIIALVSLHLSNVAQDEKKSLLSNKDLTNMIINLTHLCSENDDDSIAVLIYNKFYENIISVNDSLDSLLIDNADSFFNYYKNEYAHISACFTMENVYAEMIYPDVVFIPTKGNIRHKEMYDLHLAFNEFLNSQNTQFTHKQLKNYLEKLNTISSKDLEYLNIINSSKNENSILNLDESEIHLVKEYQNKMKNFIYKDIASGTYRNIYGNQSSDIEDLKILRDKEVNFQIFLHSIIFDEQGKNGLKNLGKKELKELNNLSKSYKKINQMDKSMK